MRTKALVQLMGMNVISWILVLVETYAMFEYVYPISPPIHEIGTFALVSIFKLLLVVLLGLIWVGAMGFLSYLYTRSWRTPKQPS
jgi:hypothetical protein